jgi:UDP-N-acetylglucosamine diphosphorylase / glucose-1-phosphate thymidylyltransferase / UDP-N-acetylgalactosamine diphosphorylase / glucosamine-1-phosphate N-acetyltransferase / galactosamine-1-phosphate N-acetyltransferase
MATLAEIYDETIEEELASWIKKHSDVAQLLNNLKSLFANLETTQILGEVHSSVSINGPVHIGAGSVIHPHVTLDGPIIIGENVSIRSHSQIRNHTYLGSNCVVGHGADIKHSLCLNGAKIQDGTFTGDSIVGVAARIGSGAILANRKFNQTEVKYKNDEGEVVGTGREFFGSVIGRHSRIGANVVLSPGTLIGEHTWVSSGCVIHGRYGSDLIISPPPTQVVATPKSRVQLRSGVGEYEHM